MKYLMVFVLLALPASAQTDSVRCELLISYPLDAPESISLRVPDKRCTPATMRHVLAYLLYRLNQY